MLKSYIKNNKESLLSAKYNLTIAQNKEKKIKERMGAANGAFRIADAVKISIDGTIEALRKGTGTGIINKSKNKPNGPYYLNNKNQASQITSIDSKFSKEVSNFIKAVN